MHGLASFFAAPLAFPFMVRGLIASALVGGLCAVMGTYVVLRGMAFFGDALAHAILPGVAVGYLATGGGRRSLFWWGLGTAVLVALGIGAISKRGKLKEDTAIGIVFAAMFALGIALISTVRGYAVDLAHFLFGNVLSVSPHDLVLIGAFGGAVLLVVALFYKEFLVISFDPDLAATLRLPTSFLRHLLLVLIAVTVVFGKDLLELVKGFFQALSSSVGERSIRPLLEQGPGRYVLLLSVATLPAAVLGLLFKSGIEELFQSPVAAGAGLILTGLVLAATALVRSDAGGKGWATPSVPSGLIIGMAQAVAMVPGVSRSGSTISAALLLGMDRKEAARFSFLMSVPAIAGAALLESRHLAQGLPLVPAAVGLLTAAVVGVAALKVLLWIVDRGRIHLFSPYCLAVGVAAILLWR